MGSHQFTPTAADTFNVVPADEIESPDSKIIRLEAELASERTRADEAEQQLAQVHLAVRSFKEKQEQVARARKARAERAEAEQLAAEAQFRAQVQQQAQAMIAHEVAQQTPATPEPTAVASNALAEALDNPDPALDERLDKYLESTFEPDRSRDWMLQE